MHSLDRRWLTGFWLILAVVAAAIWCCRFDSMLRVGPYTATTGIEEIPIGCISQSLHGEPVYTDCFRYPYRVSLYNQLFYVFYRRVALVAQPSELHLPTVLRLTTAGWTLLGCLAMLWFLRGGVPGNTAFALGMAVVAWFSPFTGWWTLSARADLPALVCQLLGLLLVLQGGTRLPWPQALAAGLLFAAAWGFKQSSVWIFAGTMTALLWQREWSNLFRIAGVFVLPVGGLLLTADRDYFENAYFALTLASSSFRQLHVILLGASLTWGPLVLVSLAVLLFGFSPVQRRRLWQLREVRVLALALAVTVTLNLLAARRVNSSANYFFESWLLSLTLAGVLQRCQPAEEPQPVQPGGLLLRGVLVLLLLLSLLSLRLLLAPMVPGEHRPQAFALQLPGTPFSEELLQEVRDSPRPLFCDDAFLLRVALGHDAAQVPVIDHGFYWDALQSGRIQDGGIQQRLQQQYYASIWLEKDKFHGDWQRLVEQAGYEAVRETGRLRYYLRPPAKSMP